MVLRSSVIPWDLVQLVSPSWGIMYAKHPRIREGGREAVRKTVQEKNHVGMQKEKVGHLIRKKRKRKAPTLHIKCTVLSYFFLFGLLLLTFLSDIEHTYSLFL
jgi:hypothetical protein